MTMVAEETRPNCAEVRTELAELTGKLSELVKQLHALNDRMREDETTHG